MSDDGELEAIRTTLAALSGLKPDEQIRVWMYVGQRLGIKDVSDRSSRREDAPQQDGEKPSQADMIDGFTSFAELYDRARPNTHPIRALIGGYWLQVCAGQSDFEAFNVNKELQNLGHKLPNVTYAFTQLKKMKPSLSMQVKKSGKSAQARKRYRLTEAGIKFVEEMIKKAGM